MTKKGLSVSPRSTRRKTKSEDASRKHEKDRYFHVELSEARWYDKSQLKGLGAEGYDQE
jgi:hypothetical protein